MTWMFATLVLVAWAVRRAFAAPERRVNARRLGLKRPEGPMPIRGRRATNGDVRALAAATQFLRGRGG